MSLHEGFEGRTRVVVGTERGFGYVFTVVFVVIGLWPLLDGQGPRLWSLAIAAAILGIALFAPHLLRPFNRLWFRFGMLLHKVVTPVLMGVVFFLTVVPTGLIFRLLGKDLLRLRCDNDAETYWIDREPRGPEPDTMPNQF